MINISRIARKYYDTSFFHVMVQGINKEYIFKKDRYINKYLQLLNEKIYKEEIKIVAYCIMNNHAHLLIKVDDIKNLSIYMQKVNTMYAKYYNYMEKMAKRDGVKIVNCTDGGILESFERKSLHDVLNK